MSVYTHERMSDRYSGSSCSQPPTPQAAHQAAAAMSVKLRWRLPVPPRSPGQHHRAIRSGQWPLVASDVSLGQDADELVALNHEHTVHLMLGQQLPRFFDVLVRADRHEILGRDVLDPHRL